ncbi:MAG: hypothetical protein IAE79_14945 [Anaerolinea sp.]|nr:hypothetical protein [Anaerolinea sp.]
MQVQYVTNEQGQRTGVLLDVAAYQRLIDRKPTDPDLLIGMSRAELEALAASRLSLASQARLQQLLAQQKEGDLQGTAVAELDELLAQTDQLTLLKTRARYTLTQTEAVYNS